MTIILTIIRPNPKTDSLHVVDSLLDSILDFRLFQTIGTYITEDTGNTAAPLLNYVHALESITDCNPDRT